MVLRLLNYPLPLSTGSLSPGNDNNMQNPAGGLLHVLRSLYVLLRTIRPKDKSPQDNSPQRKLVLRQIDPAFRRQLAPFRRQLAAFRRQLTPHSYGISPLSLRVAETCKIIYMSLDVGRDAARPSHTSSWHRLEAVDGYTIYPVRKSIAIVWLKSKQDS